VTWIVTGGAGYIGAHVVHRLHAAGHSVVVFDDLSTGLAGRLPRDIELVQGSVTSPMDLERLFADRRVTGVVHLAALKSVAESVTAPERYERHNVDGVRNLLEAMGAAGVRRLLFSSSAAVYGAPARAVVGEDSPTKPTNPYGETKLRGESLIRDAAQTYGIRSVVLRQFNVIGAGRHPGAGDTGATNLLPAVFRALEPGHPPLAVLGHTYPTRDGTAERDYVHVEDVAAAYLLGVDRLLSPDAETQLVVNIGTGRGHTVHEVLRAVAAAAGRAVPHVAAGPRLGDPPSVVASVERAAACLKWLPDQDLTTAVTSAWLAFGAVSKGMPL
jgi:UDP-glucose 4-epimerase